MKLKGEDEAIETVVKLGAQYGFGNLICRLADAWSAILQKKHGFGKATADRAAFHPSAFTDEIVDLRAEVKRLRSLVPPAKLRQMERDRSRKMIEAKKMNEYLTRLEGPEGCDFQVKPGTKDDYTWKCKGGNDKSFSQAILKKMGVNQKDITNILEIADKHGGHCDCEIILNAQKYLMKIAG